MAGISTCTLGHANPELAAAVGDQMNKFHHVSNLYYIPEQVPYMYVLILHIIHNRSCKLGFARAKIALESQTRLSPQVNY